MQVFPTTSDPFYSFTVTLENTPYVFDFFYAEREDRWYFSISLVDSTTPLVAGVKVVPTYDLLEPYRYMTSLPPGAIFALSNNGDDSPPGLSELGPSSRVSLYYLTADEITTGVIANRAS